ncbi:MAG: serine/threonine protein kinase [Candidatus Krumholzibacteria bacterium]|nr:serine/threonine protein kinase [Candidatus Krumholzibacteria bacterium]
MTERQIGNYKILKQIGVGGMAKVYLAVHKDVPNLKLVLKILSNSQHAERFMQEADKLALLDGNPNICQIRHFFDHEDELVIAMEYIDGSSLEQMIEEKDSFSITESLKIVTDLLGGLAPAHSQNIYHRDLKPGNIMFDGKGVLKIIDFGIAKGKTDPQMTIVGTAAGTPEYMAPEQFTGGEDLDYSKCDIYAVGTILYRLITGELPFKGANEFVLRDAKMFEEPPVPSSLAGNISKELDKVILKAIDKDPGARFSSMEEMRTELLRISAQQGGAAGSSVAETMANIVTGADTVGIPSSPSRRKKSRASKKSGGRGRKSSSGKVVGIVIGAVVIIAAAIFGLRMMSGGDETLSGEGQPGSSHEMGSATSDTTMSGDNAASTLPVSSGGESGTTVSTTADEKPAVRRKPPVAPGILLVTSRPGYAAVYINGKLQDEPTPFRFERPPGRYTVRIVKVVGGRELTHTETVTVTSGKMIKVSHNFEE